MENETLNNMAGMPQSQMDAPELIYPKEHCKPSKKEALKSYDIRINFLDRGCIVHVGCQSLAFEDINKAMAAINEYVTGDTYEIQQRWRQTLGLN
jgi:hypothetical protein